MYLPSWKMWCLPFALMKNVVLCCRFNFYDGPALATGLPHCGHILAGAIKDIVTRFAPQSGFHVDRRFGWACHGFPVVCVTNLSVDISVCFFHAVTCFSVLFPLLFYLAFWLREKCKFCPVCCSGFSACDDFRCLLLSTCLSPGITVKGYLFSIYCRNFFFLFLLKIVKKQSHQVRLSFGISVEFRCSADAISKGQRKPFRLIRMHRIERNVLSKILTAFPDSMGFLSGCFQCSQECEIDKTLGIKGPEDVAKLGIKEYNKQCRGIVMRYSKEWEVSKDSVHILLCFLLYVWRSFSSEVSLVVLSTWLLAYISWLQLPCFSVVILKGAQKEQLCGSEEGDCSDVEKLL